jgi:hypothetical protein
MGELTPLGASQRRFSVAFERMCNLVAIRTTGNPEETLEQLVLQCFVLKPEVRVSGPREIRRIIDDIYGLHLPAHEIQEALDRLETAGQVIQPGGTNLTISADVRRSIEDRITAATNLEEYVKKGWSDQTRVEAPGLSTKDLWDALREYLRLAFQRHGVQTVALLDASAMVDGIQTESLASLLDKIIERYFEPELRKGAKLNVSKFLSSVGDHPDRAKYLSQLADGTFNYFSLSVDPELATTFQKELKPLTLFLDTNFLFGILDLHVSPQVEVSNELLEAIARHGLPFSLYYHPATLREMQQTLDRQAEALKRRTWTRALSRAVRDSSCELSGLELRYHALNAESPIDVDSFLSLYEHVDVLLEARGIGLSQTEEADLAERSRVMSEYDSYLNDRGRPKPYESVMHDATVLCTARRLRGQQSDSLSAGALMMTCDYTLFGFDWTTARKQRDLPCTVMPNLFWQLLRPFVPSDNDFDRSFAQTFAVPEFRSIGDGSARACSKLLALLAVYRDVPEETARKLLANRPLVEKLRGLGDDQAFEREVELAIAAENTALAEEKVALERQLEAERAENARETSDLRESLSTSQAKVADLEEEGAAKDRLLQGVEARLQDLEARPEGELPTSAPASIERDERGRYASSAAILAAILGVIILEGIIHYVPIKFIAANPNAYSIQALLSVVVALGICRLFKPPFWKDWLWLFVFLPALVFLLGQLGGPRS